MTNLDIKIPWWKEHLWWPIERLWEWPREKYWDLRYFIQRGRRGWSDRDVWSLDYYLAKVISETTKELAETSGGYPVCDAMTSAKKWNKWLNGISDVFGEYIKAEDDYAVAFYNNKNKKLFSEKYYQALYKKMGKIFDYWGALWN